MKCAPPRLNPLWGSALGGNSTGQAVTASISQGREVRGIKSRRLKAHNSQMTNEVKGGYALMYGNGIDAYRQINVTTADPVRLVLMCYERAIGSLKTVKEKISSKEYEAKGKAIQKTQDILNLLMQSLDFEQGGKIATSLDALYNYMLRRLLEADLKKDEKIIEEVIYFLEELESAWKEIFSAPKNDNVSVSYLQNRKEEKGQPTRAIGAY